MTVERTFGGIRYYPDERELDLWWYWPERLGPEKAPDGRPTLSLLVVGAGANLQLGARWGADDHALEALRAHLAEAAEDAAATSLRLAAAPADVADAVLELGDGTGDFHELARAATSGVPPYQVIFSVVLDADAKNRAAHALAGRKGWLRVRYEAAIHRPAGAEGRLHGSLPPHAGTAGAREEVEAAVTRGALSIEIAGDEDDLRDRVRTLLLDQAAAAVAAPAAGAIEVDVAAGIGEVRRDPLDLVTDVGGWFAGGPDERHITNLATSP